MNGKFSRWLAALVIFLFGAAVPAALLWNPLHWAWADSLVMRLHGAAYAAPVASPVGDTKAAAQPDPAKRKIKYWHDPMLPNFVSDKPGKSPMGMDLIPVYEDEALPETGIRVDANFLQNFAVRTATAERGPIPIDIRTVGLLDYNQKDLALVNTKFEGWIEKAYVNYVGETVQKGQTLFEIYSPQLVTTQQEYLSARAYVDKLSQRGDPDAIARARSLLNATRARLHYWDIGDDQIDQMQNTGAVTRTLKVNSPVSGIVISKMSDSLEGIKLAPGMNVYKIANLSTIWAGVEIYEDQIQYMRLGRQTDITVDAFPNRHWNGRVIYLDPSVNPQTRTLKVYVEIPNPNRELRPQMYANVEVRIPAVSGAVKVPEEAVLHSGERSVVIVQKDTGLFEPREVELGALGGGYREIRKGVRTGETVVTSSQFLIDSESNLKEAIQKILGDRTSSPADSPAPAKPAAGSQVMPEHQH